MTEWLELAPFGTPDSVKGPALLERIRALDERHRAGCPAYSALADSATSSSRPFPSLADVPFLSVDLFKHIDLRSVPNDEVTVVLNSSGTGPLGPSQVALDATTARLQSRVVTRILAEILGPTRLPMLVVDAPPPRTRAGLPGPAVAAIGFMQAGRKHVFALDEHGSVQADRVRLFADEHGSSHCLVFGLTATLWHAIVDGGLRFNAPGATVLHGGGWKRLEHQRVGRSAFVEVVERAAGCRDIRNYYGLVEQVGTIFLEDGHGTLCAPAYAEVIVRDPRTLAPSPPGTTGLIQVLSAVPECYPGHSLLTGDLGRVVDAHPEDPWCGTRFEVLGRAPEADLRGCGDVA